MHARRLKWEGIFLFVRANFLKPLTEAKESKI